MTPGGDRDGMFTVLVVEDDTAIREAVAELLFLDGYTVVAARDGMEALELLHAGLRPTVIVLDLVMPRMDGWTFLSRLRIEERSTMPVLVASATAAGQLPAGADACLAKPVDLQTLKSVVASMCLGGSSPPPSPPAR